MKIETLGHGRGNVNRYVLTGDVEKVKKCHLLLKGDICDTEKVTFATPTLVEGTVIEPLSRARARKPRNVIFSRKNSFDPRGSLKTLEKLRRETADQIDRIISPGGCGYTVTVTDPEKIAELAKLKKRRAAINRQIDDVIGSGPAKTA